MFCTSLETGIALRLFRNLHLRNSGPKGAILADLTLHLPASFASWLALHDCFACLSEFNLVFIGDIVFPLVSYAMLRKLVVPDFSASVQLVFFIEKLPLIAEDADLVTFV